MTIEQTLDQLRARIGPLAAMLVFWAALAAGAGAQTPAPVPPAAASSGGATADKPPAPAPIALSDIATQAQAAADVIGKAEADLAADEAVAAAQDELPDLERDIQARQAEIDQLLTRLPTIDMLRDSGAIWEELEQRAADLTRDLTRQAGRYDERLAELQQLEEAWKLTRQPAREAGDSAGLVEQVDRIVADIARARKAVIARRAQVLALQNQAVQSGNQTRETQGAIRRSLDQATNRLLQRDRPPIWRSELRGATSHNLAEAGNQTLSNQWAALRAHAADNADAYWLHATFAIACVAGLWALRRPMRRWLDKEPELDEAYRVLDAPIATGTLIAIMAAGLFYGQAPRLWWTLLGVAGAVPTVLLTRRVISRKLYPVMYALVAFYVADQVRTLVAAAPVLSRVLFMAEMLAGLGFLLWQMRRSASAGAASQAEVRTEAEPVPAPAIAKAVRIGSRCMLVAFLIATTLHVLGYVRLGELLGTGMFSSAYLALVLHAAVEVADGLVAGSLRVPPLSLLEMVRRHRHLLKQRLQRGLRWLAAGAWLLMTLDLFALRQPLATLLAAALDAPLRFGSIEITVGSIALFAATLWGTWLVSRLIRFTLEEEFYPRAGLARGLTYAISTVLHYVILVVGFVIAIAALGVDMTRFTILAGAVGVGLGFGMQNIVNNFVSGLIVLFERPVEVGDLVQLGDTTGTVERIGIRATVIRTTSGAAIILPNGKLIADQLTNWTLSSRLRRIQVPVQVPADSDPERIIAELTGVAQANARILKTPPPEVLFLKPGPGALEFELRAWTRDVESASRVRSELVVAINRQLTATAKPS